MIMKTNLYDIKGTVKKEVDLPKVFDTPLRKDLIGRAVHAIQSHSMQAKGAFPLAGLQTSAEYVGRRRAYRSGATKGISRLPREKRAKGRLGQVKRVPQSRGGRRAHPPKVEKVTFEKINKKENKKATQSALAATANIELVKERGHKIGKIDRLPIIIENSFEDLKKTKEALDILNKLGLEKELERAAQKKIKAGKGKARGRKYKKKKSVLVIVSKKDAFKAFKNLEGIDIELVENINAELLAPGGMPGRLTVFSEAALNKISEIM